MQTLDEHFINENQTFSGLDFGSSLQRLLASLLDFLILSPVAIGLSFYNILYLKSPYLFILITLAGLVYKPFMEYKYGYTLGKKASKIKVVGADFAFPTLNEVLIRNIFNIVATLFSSVTVIYIFLEPAFSEINTYTEYSLFVQKHAKYSWFQYVYGAFFIADGIVLLTNKQKRSIHDKVANTYVIKMKD